MDELKISQALSSTFVLSGVVFQTILITFIKYIKDHTRTLLKDRRGLVLIIFLSFAALGVLFAFIGFFLQSQIGCQATVILSTVSDQAARAAISGLLLWTFAATASTRIERFTLQGLIGLRIAEGAAFTAFRAPQFAPLCVARSRNLPLAIATVAFDAAIVCLLVGCIYHRGFLDDSRKSRVRNGQPAGFALVLVTFGFFVWSSMSVPLQLGVSSTTLFSRVAIPSIGLFIFLVLIIGAFGSFPSTKDNHAISPETPTMARQLGSPQLVRSPVGGREVGQRDLQVAGPTQRESNTQSALPPSMDGNPMGDQRSGPALNQAGTEDRERTSGSIFRSIIGSPLSGAQIVITGESRLPVPPKEPPSQGVISKTARGSSKSSKRLKKALRSGPILAPQTKISGPVAISGPIPSFKTVDLAAAAELQRQRQLRQQASRNRHVEASSAAAGGGAPGSPSSAPVESLQNEANAVREEISPENSIRRPLVRPGANLNESASPLSTYTMSSSINLKGSDEMRRRSPNSLGTPEGKIGKPTMVDTKTPDRTRLTRQSSGLAPPVPSLTVLYENSTAAKSGLIVTPSSLQSPKAADVVWEVTSPAEFTPSTVSIMDRTRPKVSKEIGRTIFPRRESHPLENIRLLTPFAQQPKADSPVNPSQSSSLPTAAAKLEPLILDGVDSTTGTPGIEHRFPAPPSLAPLQLPNFSELSISQIPSDSNMTEFVKVVIESDSAQSPVGASQVATPSQGRPENGDEISRGASQQNDRPSPRSSARTAIETHRGIHEEEIKPVHNSESIDGETRRSITIELAAESDGTLSGGDDDFEMEIPIKLGNDVCLSGSPVQSKEWHYRVGDTTPLFSERRRQKGSRAMPPPVPLLLQSTRKRTKGTTRIQTELAVEQTEDEDMRSQQEATEPTDRESDRASIGREKPHSGLFRDRGSLLEKIEKELNMKEEDWHQLQNDLNRDPLTSDENCDLSSYPSTSPRSTPNRQRLSNSNDKRASLRIRSLNFPIPNNYPRASTTRKRPTRPQSDYFERAPMRLNRGSMNFLTIDNYTVQTSPTPPESERTTSDAETDVTPDRNDKISPDTDDSFHRSPAAPPVNARLWRRSFRQKVTPAALLWEAPPAKKNFPETAEPPGIALRPAMRRREAPLRIFSSQLWIKPEPRQTQQVSLWGQVLDPPTSGATQKAAQRPQRKSRRFTLLPDIVESPAPIPGKDGALGIFQGPWGPSDSAWPPMLQLPSLTASQEELLEDSPVDSYFFEDFDIASRSGRINDSTIWEIGTLLDDHNIPSRESLFPPMSIMVEDYEDEDDVDEDFDAYDDIYDAEVYNEGRE
ncbi:hypothetical protein GP486_004038 [Trichoglossum hirsutum]|uniref:Uncharacterized protein n=1 Tax=Trichoglossum hirsutum TaxID=265104 RepID=A0A9P8LBK1_9PEZI|nr:hypothetical protein GP486_004038 [Trichoglossum hirsutum]